MTNQCVALDLPTAAKPPPDPESGPGESTLAIYDGRTCCGHVTALPNGQHEARTADGRSLGLFTGWRAAADSVWLAYRKAAA